MVKYGAFRIRRKFERKQTADIRKKFGETIDFFFRNLRKFFDNLRENY